MCVGGSPRAPAPPPVLPEAPTMPVTDGSNTASNADRRRRAIAGGTNPTSTILTSSQGVTSGSPTMTKTLLGQ